MTGSENITCHPTNSEEIIKEKSFMRDGKFYLKNQVTVSLHKIALKTPVEVSKKFFGVPHLLAKIPNIMICSSK